MTAKSIAAAGVAVLVVFTAGIYFGPQIVPGTSATLPAPPSAMPAASGEDAQTIASLRAENQRLRSDLAGVSADVARLNEANGTLAADLQRAAEALRAQKPAAARKGPTLGMARWEVQRETLNNLRQIDMARKQFRKEKGKIAGSIDALVGRNSFIRSVRSVNGEDYAALSMNPDEPMMVTAPDGLVVTFDPLGKNTTDPEYPPEVVRVHEIEKTGQMTLGPALVKALAAYRAANNGGSPPNDNALLPYFADSKEAADYVEWREARKAAGM